MVQVNVPFFKKIYEMGKMEQFWLKTLILTNFTNKTKNLQVFWP
jgi:hypothetical protein